MPTQVILDTDIGTDVDDCLALALILGSPELHLVGVTCVYGDVDLRARMVIKLLGLRGRTDVPVLAGARRPLLGRRSIYWGGHEGQGLLGPGDEQLTASREHAVDFLIRTILEHPGQIHLVAIGPLTNVALALLREPNLSAKLAQLTIMGGACRGPGSLGLAIAEHNIKCDPEAAHVVLSAGAPTTLIPLDVTTRVRIRTEDAARIRSVGTPFHVAVATQVEAYPPFKRRGWTHLHDPLAAATLLRPDLVGLEPLRVDVELSGEHTTGATLMRAPTAELPANTKVALSVKATAFERFVVERLTG